MRPEGLYGGAGRQDRPAEKQSHIALNDPIYMQVARRQDQPAEKQSHIALDDPICMRREGQDQPAEKQGNTVQPVVLCCIERVKRP